MIKLLYQGVDTLDVAIMGAAPPTVLAELKSARAAAEDDHYNTHGIHVQMGVNNRRFVVKAHGKSGGYRYTVVDEETGTIISIKVDQKPQNANIFVSCRAHSLLSRGYTGMRAEIDACLAALGIVPQGYRVNRLDFALDFLAPDFVLDMKQFVAFGGQKVVPHYVSGRHLNDLGDKFPNNVDTLPIGSVMRGGRFETVTVGKMPGRQVTVYDKSRAAKDQHTPFWYEVWGLDQNDTSQRVWRVEIRAAKNAWTRIIGPTAKRTYETIDALLPRFLQQAVDHIRYVQDRDSVSNVSRAELHPLWRAVMSVVADLPDEAEPPLTPEYIQILMRKEREAMSLAQGFGNLNNLLMLKGMTVEEVVKRFPQLAAEQAAEYVRTVGEDRHREKLSKSRMRNIHWLSHEDWDRNFDDRSG